MNVKYTRHATLRLKVRDIGRDEVERVLRSPSSVYYDTTDTKSVDKITRRRVLSGRWVKVW